MSTQNAERKKPTAHRHCYSAYLNLIKRMII
jgi:hypothetical protein